MISGIMSKEKEENGEKAEKMIGAKLISQLPNGSYIHLKSNKILPITGNLNYVAKGIIQLQNGSLFNVVANAVVA